MRTTTHRGAAPLFLAAAAILSCLSLAGCPQPGAAAGPAGIYYIAPGGDDSASGSRLHPWATFARAMGDLEPGDLVLVRGGSYSQRLVITVSGEEGKPITFAAYPGESPVIDGTGLAIPNGNGGLVEAVGKSYLTVSGLAARNSSGAAIYVFGGRGLSVVGNSIRSSASSGILAWEDRDLVIEGNTVVDACLGGEGYQECISISGSTGFSATGNTVIGGGMEGIDVKDGSSNGLVADNLVRDLPRVGIYIDAWDTDLSGIEVARNRSWNNKVGITVNSENGGICGEVLIHDNDLACNLECGLWIGAAGVEGAAHPVVGVEAWGNRIRDTRKGDGVRIAVAKKGRTERIYLHDNLVYRNGRAGIMVADWRSGDTSGSNMSDVRLVNNTVVANGRDLATDGGWGAGGIALFIADASGLVVRNNLIADHPRFSIATDSAVIYGPATDRGFLAIDHNSAAAFAADAYGYNQTVGDAAATGAALFVDAAAADYRPAAGSAAIGAGIAAGAPAADFAGAARPASGTCTAGAYEYAAPPAAPASRAGLEPADVNGR